MDVFLRRQDVIDRFDANFQTDDDGHIIFQPPGSEYGAPVSAEEYDAVMAAFERRQTGAQIVNWLAFGAAGAYGIYQVAASSDYGAFFAALGAAFAISFAQSFRAFTTPLRPFVERRDALRAASEKPGTAAED